MTVPTKLQAALVEIGILWISFAKVVVFPSKGVIGITRVQ
jgi:hypothetical protein